MSNQKALKDILSSFNAARRDIPEGDDLAGALTDIIQAGISGLLKRLASSSTHSAPSPKLLFGGTFQCYPLPDPFSPAFVAPEMTPDRITHETGRLFAQAIKVWNVSGDSPGLGELSNGVVRLSQHLTSCAAGIEERARARLAAVEEAVSRLEGLAAQQQELESQLHKKKEANDATLKKLEQLRIDIATAASELNESSDEEQQLNERVMDLRRRAKSIEELRRECAELREAVDKGEKELEQMQRKRNDLVRQRHDTKQKMKDTHELVQQIENEIDPAIAEKIKQIWKLLPADVFDERLKKR